MLSKDEQERGMKQCDGCGNAYDPVQRRWRCPWCGLKENCCEGAPQGVIFSGSDGAGVNP